MSDELHVNDKALATYGSEQPSAVAIRSIDDIKRMSLIFVKSGMFKGDKHLDEQTKMYQAGVKIIAGVEFGIQPFAAMRGINIINGNAEMSANLMAAKVKKHPKYDYRVKKWDHDGCVLTFLEVMPDGSREELGESSFDAEDAKLAQLDRNDNWRKFARNMYFARAMSNGVRIFCPDVFYGAPVYTHGEISGDFADDTGEPEAGVHSETTEPVEAEVVDKTADEPPMTAEQRERILKLGKEIGLNEKTLKARVAKIASQSEAAEAINVLEADLARGGAA